MENERRETAGVLVVAQSVRTVQEVEHLLAASSADAEDVAAALAELRAAIVAAWVARAPVLSELGGKLGTLALRRSSAGRLFAEAVAVACLIRAAGAQPGAPASPPELASSLALIESRLDAAKIEVRGMACHFAQIAQGEIDPADTPEICRVAAALVALLLVRDALAAALYEMGVVEVEAR